MITMNEAKQCPERSLRSVTPAPQHKPRVSVLVRPSISPSPFSFLTIDDVVVVIAVLEVAESYYFTRAVGVPLRAAAQPRSSVRPSVRPVNAISVNMAVYPHCSHPAAQSTGAGAGGAARFPTRLCKRDGSSSTPPRRRRRRRGRRGRDERSLKVSFTSWARRKVFTATN